MTAGVLCLFGLFMHAFESFSSPVRKVVIQALVVWPAMFIGGGILGTKLSDRVNETQAWNLARSEAAKADEQRSKAIAWCTAANEPSSQAMCIKTIDKGIAVLRK